MIDGKKDNFFSTSPKKSPEPNKISPSVRLKLKEKGSLPGVMIPSHCTLSPDADQKSWTG
jgi:hypothetical protein